MKRRAFLISGAALVLTRPAFAEATLVIEVFKSPTCGCCTAWVERVRQAEFAVDAQDVDQDALHAFKDRLQIAPKIAGCHTAVVGSHHAPFPAILVPPRCRSWFCTNSHTGSGHTALGP